MSSPQNRMWRGRVWTGARHGPAFIEDGVVETTDGLISNVREPRSTDPVAQLDQFGRPHTLIPGMVDLHNHGGLGQSFPTSDQAGCRTAAAYHRSRGTTTLLASLVSADGAELIDQASVLTELADDGVIAGIHLEGPFLSATRCGAQDPTTLLAGDPQLLRRIIEASRGHLRTITIAPEVQQFQEVLQVCADHRIVVSMGHSDASADRTHDAVQAAHATGAQVTATHLFNGMPTMHHRDPGIAGALLQAATESRVVVELIADGIHVHDSMVAVALAAAPEHVALVSDAMAAAGIGDGHYSLGGASVTVRSGVARLTNTQADQGSIAGGTSSLVDQLLRHGGCALLRGSGSGSADITHAARIVRACTSTPAAVLGLHDRGALSEGLRADLVMLDSAGEVAAVLVEGREQ